MSYGDAEGFADYIEARGREISDEWALCDINAALLFASEWIDGVYGPSFLGYKAGGFEQVREWPRKSAIVETCVPVYTFASDAIPDRVVNATYEAAYRQLSNPGTLQPDYIPGKYKSVTIEGALSVDYVQFSSAADVQMQVSAIDNLLAPLMNQNSGAVMSSLSGGASRV